MSDRPIHFPSDLHSEASDARLAGRVIAKDASFARIADAFASVLVRGELAADVGDLVVVSVRPSNGELVLAGLIERHRPAEAKRSEHARLVDGGIGKNLQARSRAFAIIRAFFARRAFVEVDTPLLVPSPGLDLHLDAVEAGGAYLITSPEYQMKRLVAGGVPRLYQLSHVFRRGEHGSQHDPEFTMLEWYRAFAGVEEVMRDTEELVAEVSRELGGRLVAVPPFSRVSVREAFDRFASVGEAAFFSMAENDADTFFRILVEKVEPALASLPAPVFLVDYPISQASLARARPADPRVCERFELYVGGVELCNGFGELTDPVEQRRRLGSDQKARAAAKKPVYPIDERFVAALEEGMPPSAGNALGVDRLVALCLGEREIARVMPFPAGVL